MIFAVLEDRDFIEMIERAAKAEGQFCRFFQDEKSLDEAIAQENPRVLLLDITVPFLDGPTWVEKTKQSVGTRDIPLMVFGGSIRADLLHDAQELGANKVFHKAAFREQLPGLLRHYGK